MAKNDKKMYSIMFSIGGELSKTFTNATFEANHKIKKLNADFKKSQMSSFAHQQKIAMNHLNKSSRDLGKAWGNLVAPIKKLGILSAGASVAMFAIANSTAKAGDDAIKTAKKLGITTEAFSSLNYAASQSGVSGEEFSTSLKKLNQTMMQASRGSKEAELAFRRAGVSIYDNTGKLKSADALMLEISNTFAKMPEGVYKADLAMAIFGKSGANMVPLLEQGSDAIKKQRERAHQLGIVLSEEAGRNASKFRTNLTDLIGAFTGFKNILGNAVIPLFSNLMEKMVNWWIINKEFVSVKIHEYLVKFESYLPMIKNGLISIRDKVKDFIDSMGGFEGVITKAGKLLGLLNRLKFIIIGIMLLTPFVNFVKSLVLVIKVMAMVKWIQMIKSIKLVGLALVKTGVGLKAFGLGFLKVSAIMLASPITWIIAGVVALGVAVYLLIKHWDKVKVFFANLWQKVKEVFFNAWEFIKNIFFNYHPYGLIYKHWDKITEFFKGLWEGVKNSFSSAWDFIKGIVDKVAGAVSKVTGFVGKLNPFKSKDGKETVEIPAYANGGIVNRPTFAMVGEAGPEAIIPLNRPNRANELLNKAGLVSNNKSSFVFSPTINISGNVDEIVVRDSISDLKRQFEKWINEREHNQRRVVLV